MQRVVESHQDYFYDIENANEYLNKAKNGSKARFTNFLSSIKKLDIKGKYLEIGSGPGVITQVVAIQHPNTEIIANDISEFNIKLLANKILEAIRDTYIPYKFEKTITYTVSIGVSKTYENMNNKNLFKLADNALYKSKDNGKNQVQYII